MAAVIPSEIGEIAKEAVQETILGSDESSQKSSSFADDTHARFEKFAHRDEETGELILSPEEFIEVVTEGGEDFVSQTTLPIHVYGTFHFQLY